ncbi:PolyA_pol-domain-containing protein, partial [Fragilariopsis cylindrus CCMP1102]
PKRGYGPYINLSPEERELFRLIRKARDESGLSTTMRVAGGWVRDKLLATPEFTRTYGKVIGDGKKNKKKNNKNSINSKNASTAGSMQRFQQHEPVDIDIALDDMLGREFAELLNECLSKMGEKTHGVGVVLKNPEKSKHLETATMKVGTFWIDFVNLRAEEYTQDSRIPDLMRIGTPSEDAFRRDLTINSLFYNVNNGQVEDWTGRGFEDLRRCVVSTPLAPLTTLLDDPLRTLRSVRFAARLRFTMDDALVEAAMDDRVRKALAEKVSRERIGCEVDLMLRSPDPVGAMRLLINLNLARTVFPIEKLLSTTSTTSISSSSSSKNEDEDQDDFYEDLFERGLDLLSTNYDQLEECKLFPPVWCNKSYQGSYTTHGTQDISLSEDDDALRYMWYASFLKPLYDHSLMIDPLGKNLGKKANRSVVCKLLVDELKRPTREAEAVGKIMKGANDFKQLMDCGGDFSAVSILLSDIRVHEVNDDNISSSSSSSDDDVSDISSNASQGGVGSRKMKCSMNGQDVYTATENDPVWDHAMEFRLQCSNIMRKVGPLWRAALFLAMSEHITEALQDDLDYVIEGDIVDESQEDLRQREIERYDSVGTAMQRIGLVGIYEQKPLMDGGEVKKVLPNIPKGPIFRDIMDEQVEWMTLHPCAGADILARHLAQTFPDYQ